MAEHTFRTTQRPMPNPPLREFSRPRSKRSKMTSCFCRRNADAVVSHNERRVSVVCLDRDVNRMAGPEPDGVRDQVSTIWSSADGPTSPITATGIVTRSSHLATASSASKEATTSRTTSARSTESNSSSIRPLESRDTSRRRSRVSSSRCKRCSIRRSCPRVHSAGIASPERSICSALSMESRI